ncbi:hypothetical protein M0R72_05360 [Candidatus Pacearchaeota archaeon]|jgi:uncharacterized membrane protein|nr:hypothetical protein [Candidatus Pacearchaeota archaeon]
MVNNYFWTIFIISICGVLFSGFLSYRTLFSKSCSLKNRNCGETKILGIPVCIYGLIMYLIILTISLLGILNN